MRTKSAGSWVEDITGLLDESAVHFGHGTDNSMDEAAWMVLHVLGKPLDGSFVDWDCEVTSGQAETLREIVSRRTDQQIPLAYLLGTAWFAGLEFEVTPDVLVPRSPIAELILQQFSPWIDQHDITSVLDLCTGSGCIGIATAVWLPWATVEVSDISEPALAVAKRNVTRHQLESRVSVVRSDLFGSLGGRLYDLVLTNPPYVPAGDMSRLPGEYLAEPELGLVSGPDGLDLCLQIMMQSPHYLHEHGVLICEVGESAETLAESLPHIPFLWLEFEKGGSGVFLLTREELVRASSGVANLIKDRNHVG